MNELVAQLVVGGVTAAMRGGPSAVRGYLRTVGGSMFEQYVASHPIVAARLFALSRKLVSDLSVSDLRGVLGQFLDHQEDRDIEALLLAVKNHAYAGETAREFMTSGRILEVLHLASVNNGVVQHENADISFLLENPQ